MKDEVRAIPDGYQAVTPCLCVKDATSAIDFYSRALGAEEVVRMPAPNGKIGHAGLALGGSRIMPADESPEMDCLSPQSIGGSPVHLHLDVEDVDTRVAQAKAAGARILRPMIDKFYGDRSDSAEDPYGHVWHISTRMEDLSPEEVPACAAKFQAENPM